MIVSWLAGFAVYEWLAQTQDLGFWTDFLARLNPPHSQIGASLPGLRGLVRARGGRVVRGAAERRARALAPEADRRRRGQDSGRSRGNGSQAHTSGERIGDGTAAGVSRWHGSSSSAAASCC